MLCQEMRVKRRYDELRRAKYTMETAPKMSKNSCITSPRKPGGQVVGCLREMRRRAFPLALRDDAFRGDEAGRAGGRAGGREVLLARLPQQAVDRAGVPNAPERRGRRRADRRRIVVEHAPQLGGGVG